MQYSLKKTDKLRFKADFDYVRENGVKYVSPSMLLVVAATPDETMRCGVVCGRKFSNLAVVRNRARRLFWESFRHLKPEIQPGSAHLVLIPRQRIVGKKQYEVEQELRGLLARARLVRDIKPGSDQ